MTSPATRKDYSMDSSLKLAFSDYSLSITGNSNIFQRHVTR